MFGAQKTHILGKHLNIDIGINLNIDQHQAQLFYVLCFSLQYLKVFYPIDLVLVPISFGPSAGYNRQVLFKMRYKKYLALNNPCHIKQIQKNYKINIFKNLVDILINRRIF